MATSLIMPALEMAQESGTLVRWLKRDGEAVTKGDPVMEIETDKVTVEIEAPESGILGGILAKEGDVVPVGQTVAWILAPGESVPAFAEPPSMRSASRPGAKAAAPHPQLAKSTSIEASPLARRMADEHGIDLALIKSNGRRVEKADVQNYLKMQKQSANQPAAPLSVTAWRLMPASPKARRLAGERGLKLATIAGSGPDGAVLADDVLAAETSVSAGSAESVSTTWRVMAERMAASWTTVPHFYLVREVDVGNLVQWRKGVAPTIEKQAGFKPTYTDLLVKLLGVVLRIHPRLNAAWADGGILQNREINVGIATAIEDGLIVPVVRGADAASLSEITVQRHDLTERAQNHKLRPADITGGTFTLSNLGMYNVDAFNAIINAPQAAILAVGRITERVVPLNGQVVIRPMMILSLSCDHRVVDGARGAEFLDDLANLIEDPLRLLQ